MKGFTKLAIVSSIVMSGHAFAMQSLDDSALSAATGQDGLTVSITPPTGGFTIDELYIHDKDGLTGVTGQTAVSGGAIVLGAGSTQFAVDTGNSPIVVKIDADGGAVASPAPVLNVNVALPATFKITTGDIAVAASKRNGLAGTAVASTVRGISSTGMKTVINSFGIDLSGAQLNVQLGNQPQGALVKLTGSLASGLTLSGITLNDNTGGGAIKVGNIYVTDTGAAGLSLASTIKATTNGLEVLYAGSSSAKTDVFLEDVRLGNVSAATSSIGDVEISGLNAAGTKITVTGH